MAANHICIRSVILSTITEISHINMAAVKNKTKKRPLMQRVGKDNTYIPAYLLIYVCVILIYPVCLFFNIKYKQIKIYSNTFKYLLSDFSY